MFIFPPISDQDFPLNLLMKCYFILKKKRKKKGIIWYRGNCYSLLLYTKTYVSLLESALLDVFRGERHRLHCCWRRVTSVIPCHSHWARMSFFRTLQASVWRPRFLREFTFFFFFFFCASACTLTEITWHARWNVPPRICQIYVVPI